MRAIDSGEGRLRSALLELSRKVGQLSAADLDRLDRLIEQIRKHLAEGDQQLSPTEERINP